MSAKDVVAEALHVPCPVHRMRDCSPLLNGCAWPSTMQHQADEALDALYKTGWLRDDPESKRHHIAKWDADLRDTAARLRDVLTDLIEHVSGHHLSYQTHDHDCYQEWTLLRDEARGLLARDQ